VWTGRFIPLETIRPSPVLPLFDEEDGSPLEFSKTLTLTCLAKLHPMMASVIRPLRRVLAKHPLMVAQARQANNISILIPSTAMNTLGLTLPTTQSIILGCSKQGGLAVGAIEQADMISFSWKWLLIRFHQRRSSQRKLRRLVSGRDRDILKSEGED